MMCDIYIYIFVPIDSGKTVVWSPQVVSRVGFVLGLPNLNQQILFSIELSQLFRNKHMGI